MLAASAARPPRLALRADVLDAIRRMRVLQIDTIHASRAARSVLWSRLGDSGEVARRAAGRRPAVRILGPAEAYLPIEDYPALAAHARPRGQRLARRPRLAGEARCGR
jgi:uncharacterized protein YcaQ